ncbi:hypothetical protein V8E36_001624 [Tilletia maclaganii]
MPAGRQEWVLGQVRHGVVDVSAQAVVDGIVTLVIAVSPPKAQQPAEPESIRAILAHTGANFNHQPERPSSTRPTRTDRQPGLVRPSAPPAFTKTASADASRHRLALSPPLALASPPRHSLLPRSQPLAAHDRARASTCRFSTSPEILLPARRGFRARSYLRARTFAVSPRPAASALVSTRPRFLTWPSPRPIFLRSSAPLHAITLRLFAAPAFTLAPTYAPSPRLPCDLTFPSALSARHRRQEISSPRPRSRSLPQHPSTNGFHDAYVHSPCVRTASFD